jgi:hypothetical protein
MPEERGRRGGGPLQPPADADVSGAGVSGAGVRAGGGGTPDRPRGRAIERSEFEQVIRRAAELTLRDADADEQLSEDEVFRVATELGLPAHHVRRALFELPELTVQPRWYDRYYDAPVFSAARVVPSQAGPLLRRIEEYLVTREYLQIVRRRGENIAFVPADDAISSVARAFLRSGPRHHIARATRVLVSAHAMPDDSAHVRFDVDLSEERRSSASGASAAGLAGGFIVGAVAAHFAGVLTPAGLGVVPEVVAFGGGMAATFAATFSAAAKRFRNRVHTARLEIIGLLDRLEHGERLEPPPAPWRRRLFGGG